MNLSVFANLIIFLEIMTPILPLALNVKALDDINTRGNDIYNTVPMKNLFENNNIQNSNNNTLTSIISPSSGEVKMNLSIVSVVVVVDNNNATVFLGDGINYVHDSKPATSTIKRPYTLVLSIVPILTVFGNGLVIMAVYRERSLQTVTNLLIVSLAVSDFLVAICVMSFAVYFEWNSFIWNLGPTLCNLYIGADVACSTASIFNLLAISLDRFMAIKYPLTYTQYVSNNNRALFSIFVVWSISLGVGLPVFFGANNIDQNKEEFCEFTNPYFIIISSILSFFVPCALMIVLYAVIFQQLRARERARTLRHLRRTKRDAGIEANKSTNERIGSALISGARWHCQMGTHFKTRGDQMLLELSLQTSSFPTLTPSASTESMISRWYGGFETTHSSLNIQAADSTLNVNRDSSETSQHNPQSPENDDQHSAQRQQDLLHLRRCNTVPLPTANNSGGGIEKNNRKTLAVALLQKSRSNVFNDSLRNIYNSSNSFARPNPANSNLSSALTECALDIGTRSNLINNSRISNLPFSNQHNGNINKNNTMKNENANNITNKIFGVNNSAFGGHFDDLFPFIDSLSQSSSCGERLANYCHSNQYLRQSSRNGSLVNKNRLTVSQLTPPMSKRQFQEDCANSDVPQISSATVFDALLIGQEFSSDIHLPLRLTASNGNLCNHSDSNYLSLSFVNTAFNSPLAQKSTKFSQTLRNGNACYATKTSNNNTNNNNINNYHVKCFDTNNFKNSAKSINSKRGCCNFMYSCERLFEWFRISPSRSNISSTSPTGICADGHSTMIRDYSTMTLNNSCRKTVDKNNNVDFTYVGKKRKDGNNFGKCLTFIGEFCLELWQKVYIGKGSYQKRFRQSTRPSRQLVKKATKQMKREQKATVTLAVVLAVFLVCWVPFFTLHLTNAICILTERDSCVYFLATFLSTWLGYLNSSLNPLIYTVFDQRFRKAFRNILKCRH